MLKKRYSYLLFVSLVVIVVISSCKSKKVSCDAYTHINKIENEAVS